MPKPHRRRPGVLERSTITDASLSALAAGCPKLRSLTVNLCRLTDAGFIQIVQGCPKLEVLSADEGRHRPVTDAAVHAWADCKAKLRRLSLDCCHDVTDRRGRAATLDHPETLETRYRVAMLLQGNPKLCMCALLLVRLRLRL